MTRSLSRICAVATAVLGPAAGLFLVYGPTGTRCGITNVVQPGAGPSIATLTPMVCESTRMVDIQQIWPMPGVALTVWSLAPLLALVGIWTGRFWLVTAALVIEATSLLSFGAGPLYVPFVLLPLAVTWEIARRARREQATPRQRGIAT